MKKMKRKENANKGFSLVELIVVVAIMAVLVGILAPQYMRYLEKSRLGKDNDQIDSVKKAVEIALTDEDIYKAVAAASADPEITFSSTGYTWSNEVAALTTEVANTVPAGDCKMTSKAYIGDGATAPKLTIDRATMKVATGGGYKTK